MAIVALVFVAACPSGVSAGQPCEVIPMPCTFEAGAFRLSVIDALTKKPLSGVHALAEWQLRGMGGRLNGPIMALDSTSGTDGGLTFPAWGPLEGPVTGLGVGRDPVLSLFKSGYRVLIIEN